MQLTLAENKKPDWKTEAKSQEDSLHLLDATIVMVDDEPTTMEVVQAFLEEAGYQNFVLIEDSTQAMNALEQKRPDILLLDLMMPEVSGFDVLRSVREHPKLKHLPVIVLTSSSDDEDKLKALDLGATDFLSKPVDPSELRLRVRNTLAAKAYVDDLAFYDPLTRLPNRHLFMERLDWALKSAERAGESLALLTIELDKFDKISDTLGLLTGDEVLRQVAERIINVVRSIDVLGHFEIDQNMAVNLFYFNGGVFSLLLHRVQSERDTAQAAERILESIRGPLLIENTEIYLTASIGIATCLTESLDGVEILQLASSAKDYAKSRGGNCFQFSSKRINAQYRMRLSIEARLRKALERNEFVLHYQPKLDVQTNAITGVEALLRWQSRDDGLVPPDKFIPIAEEIGLIIPIGEWVLSSACSHLKAWQEAGKVPIGMAVNLSPVQFQHREMTAVFRQIIENSGIDPQVLTLELTESMLLEDVEKSIGLMHRLKDMGFRLAMDDFGTGYSSLNYLRRLPIDELKIDRSFFTDLFEDTKSRALVSSLIFLSRYLNLLTVAEGVETKEQLDFLRQERCDQYQGFLFSPALPNTEVFELLS